MNYIFMASFINIKHPQNIKTNDTINPIALIDGGASFVSLTIGPILMGSLESQDLSFSNPHNKKKRYKKIGRNPPSLAVEHKIAIRSNRIASDKNFFNISDP